MSKDKNIRIVIVLAIMFVISSVQSALCQPPPPGGPPCWPPPCGIPLDGGLTFLAVAGAALAGKKLYNKKIKDNL